MKMLSLENELRENAYRAGELLLVSLRMEQRQLLHILSWAEVRTAETVCSLKRERVSAPRHLTRLS